MDTETTGLVPNGLLRDAFLPEVIEFYGALMEYGEGGRGELVKELDILIRPRQRIDEGGKAFRVHGISNAKVAGKPMFHEVAKSIKDMIEEAPLVIAHNASFDKEVIDIEMRRCDLSIRWPRVMCTIEQTMHVAGYRLSLGGMHDMLVGHKFLGAHKASVDVAALSRCVEVLIKDGVL
jgi:DNA polymerase III epsilon subunit-like protein